MLFPDLDDNTLFVYRADAGELLSSFSEHGFDLEGVHWPSVEHYFQAMKFQTNNPEYYERIRLAPSSRQARKLGRTRLKRIRSDWSKVRRVVMTRGVYTKCHSHPEVKAALLASGDRKIMEGSQYDYFWGCGRDRRGENTYGQVLMDVRAKLREEAESQ